MQRQRIESGGQPYDVEIEEEELNSFLNFNEEMFSEG